MFYGSKKASELTPYQYDAFVKHYFLKFGVKPAEVDEMDVTLVNALMELRVLEADKENFKSMEADNKMKMKGWMDSLNKKPARTQVRNDGDI